MYHLAWSPHETQILATGNNDGSVKFYDLKDGKKSSIQLYRVKSATPSPCRDLKFNPIDKTTFATASENGRLYIWDRRNNKKPLLSYEAHKSKVLSISWNPFSEWLIATGSADKTVKVWDTGQCALEIGDYSSSASVTHNTAAEMEPLLLHTIHTSAEVSQILWNPLENTSNQHSSRHLMTMSSAVGSEGSCGHISIWDLDRANIPICILKGHGDDRCTKMDWLDCNRSTDLIEYRVNRTVSTKGKKALPTIAAAGVANSDGSGKLSPATTSSSDSPTKPRIVARREVLPVRFHWVISSSKEGMLLVQAPKYGYFPYNHLSPIVAIISSQGHLAYQHSEFKKMEEPPRNIPTAALLKSQKVSSSQRSADENSPSKKEADLGAFTVVVGERGKSEKSSRGGYQQPQQTAGKVYFGFAEFENLEAARKARSKGGAEATVFDPALIYLLAKHYSIPQPPPRQPADSLLLPTGEDEKLEAMATSVVPIDYDYLVTCYEISLASCKHNFEVASMAGLRCRAALWASLEALLPYPVSDTTPSNCKSPPPAEATATASPGESPPPPPQSCTSEADLDHCSREISFSFEVLSTLLVELLEGGDSQHFVVACEILRCAQVLSAVLKLSNISPLRIRSIYIAYIELLMKQELFNQANQIIKGSDDEQIASLSRKDVDLKIKCATCKKDCRRKSITVASATVWCETCQRCVSKCAVCDLPVKGLLQWCPICAHGGHLSCLQKWFTEYTCCPTGCAHQCCFSFYQPQPSKARLSGLTDEEVAQLMEEERYADIDSLLVKKRQLLQNRRTAQLEGLFS